METRAVVRMGSPGIAGEYCSPRATGDGVDHPGLPDLFRVRTGSRTDPGSSGPRKGVAPVQGIPVVGTRRPGTGLAFTWRMASIRIRLSWVVPAGLALAICACGGSSDAPSPPPPAPTGLSYDSGATLSLQVNQPAAPVVPVVTGTSLAFSVAPPLPAGLTIHPSTGTLSGTPTVAATLATYAVTASNGGGSTTANLSLVVNAAGGMTCDATTCLDPATGLRWQRARAPQEMNWQDATTYCANLSLGGRGGFRLPSVNDLRTLVVGCPATMTGGSCRVVDPTCLSLLDCFNAACGGCTTGRGADGRYWEQGVWQGGGTVFWSSSRDIIAWTVGFLQASLDGTWSSASSHGVRCVTGP